VEEVHHAKEEGIIFDLLTNPTEILTDDKGWVTGMKCVKMELGEPDASGRRRPVEVPGSEFVMELDTVIMSLGTSPNPLISSTTEGLETNKWKCIVADEENGTYNIEKIDVVFPVLHGLNGEDGTIQGLFELAGIPYVGCGVLASSTGMDKLSTKKVVEPLGIRQAKYVPVFYGEEYLFEMYAKAIEDEFPYPVFVKPSNAGSSKGVSKACNREELKTAIEEAAKHDNRILVEEMICGREVECAVLGSGAGKVDHEPDQCAVQECIKIHCHESQGKQIQHRNEDGPWQVGDTQQEGIDHGGFYIVAELTLQRKYITVDKGQQRQYHHSYQQQKHLRNTVARLQSHEIEDADGREEQ